MRRKHMGFAYGDTAERVILDAVGKCSSVKHILEGRRGEAGLIFVAESAKQAVLIGNPVIDANVGIIPAVSFLWFSKKIGTVDVHVRNRKKRRDAGRKRINRSCWKNVRRIAHAIHPNRHAAKAAGI